MLCHSLHSTVAQVGLVFAELATQIVIATLFVVKSVFDVPSRKSVPSAAAQPISPCHIYRINHDHLAFGKSFIPDFIY